MIYDFFCDASIVANSTYVGAGYVVVCRDTEQIDKEVIVQRQGTNNSGEILAIWAGVRRAIEIAKVDPEARFRLFSDSKISLYGVKRWMMNWIKTQEEDGTLYNSAGQPVANQEIFIDIYNMLVQSGIHISFFHQRGHVLERIGLEKAKKAFRKANNTNPDWLGIDIYDISNYNAMVDNYTREVVTGVYHGVPINQYYGASYQLIFPMRFRAMPEDLQKFAACIFGRPPIQYKEEV